jgi:hypothetical protein
VAGKATISKAIIVIKSINSSSSITKHSMWGVYDGVAVYGFMEENYDRVIDRNWLEEKFPGIEIFPNHIQKGCMSNAIYGVSAGYNGKTGQMSVESKDKQLVEDLYKCVTEHEKIKNVEKDGKDGKDGKDQGSTSQYSEVEFWIAVVGEYDKSEQAQYIPGETDLDE